MSELTEAAERELGIPDILTEIRNDVDNLVAAWDDLTAALATWVRS